MVILQRMYVSEVYAKLLCFSFDESDKSVFENHMKSLFEEVSKFNGWAEDAGQVVRIICYKLIGTIQKDAKKSRVFPNHLRINISV